MTSVIAEREAVTNMVDLVIVMTEDLAVVVKEEAAAVVEIDEVAEAVEEEINGTIVNGLM